MEHAQTLTNYRSDIDRGERFAFGENWRAFLQDLTDERIEAACESLREFIGWRDLRNMRFLDIGSGSGLFSLAARRLGANVQSIDFDAECVACAETLRDRYCSDDPGWTIAQGSALEASTLPAAESADIVYSWGVLHHTGRMWDAMDNAARCVGPGGLLYVAIYNDQGWRSRAWLAVKRLYNALPRALRWTVLWPCAARLWAPAVVRNAVIGRPASSTRVRGMNPWWDLVDWVGGLPFEVAKPEEVLDFLRPRGFTLMRLRTCGGGLGCNEFLLRREATR